MSLSRILNDEPLPVHPTTRPPYTATSRPMPVDSHPSETSPHSSSGRISPTQYDIGDSSRGYSYHETEAGALNCFQESEAFFMSAFQVSIFFKEEAEDFCHPMTFPYTRAKMMGSRESAGRGGRGTRNIIYLANVA